MFCEGGHLFTQKKHFFPRMTKAVQNNSFDFSSLDFNDFRRDVFFSSLRGILSSLSSDLYVKQMFEDSRTQVFIPDRIIEIFKEHLSDDREKAMQGLYKRLSNANDLFYDKTQMLAQFKLFLADIYRDIDQLKNHMIDDLSFCRENVMALTHASVARSFEADSNEGQYLKNISECHRVFNTTIPSMRKRYESEILEKDREIQKLNNHIKNLRRKLNLANLQKEKAEDNLTYAKNELARIQTENEALKENDRDRQIFEGRIVSLEEEITSKNEKIENFLNELQSSSSIETNSKLLILKLKDELNNALNENLELKGINKKLEIENKQLTAKQNLNDADIQLLKSRLSQMETLQNDRDRLIGKIQNANSLNFQLKSKIEHLKKWNKDLKEELNKLKFDLSEMTTDRNKSEEFISEISQYKEELESIRKDCNHKDDQINDLSKNLNEFKQKYREADQLLRNTDSTLQEKIEENQVLQERINNFDNEKEIQNNEIKKLEKKANKMRQIIREQLTNKKAYLEEIENLRSHLESIENEKKNTLIELREAHSSISQLNKSQEISLSTIAKSQIFEKEMKAKIINVENEKITLNDQLGKTMAEMNKTREISNQKEIENVKLQERLSSAKNKLKKYEDKMKALNEQYKSISTTNISLTNENQQLKDEINQKSEEFNNMLKTFQNIKEKNQEFYNKIKANEAKLSEITTENTKLKIDFDKKERTHSTEIIKLKEEINSLKKTSKNISDEKEELEKSLKKEKIKADEMKTRLYEYENQFKSDNETHSIELNNLKNEIEIHKNENHHACKKTAELQSKIRQIESHLQLTFNEIPTAFDSINEKNKQYEKAINSIRSLFAIPRNSLEELVVYFQKIKANYDSLTDKEAKYKSIFRTNNNIFDEIQTFKINYDSQLRDLKRLMTFLNVDSVESLINSVKDLKQHENELISHTAVIKKLVLNTDNQNDSTDTESDFQNIYDAISSIINENNDIKIEIGRTQEENEKIKKQIKKVLSASDDENESDIDHIIQKLEIIPVLKNEITTLSYQLDDSKKFQVEVMKLVKILDEINAILNLTTENNPKDYNMAIDIITKLKQAMTRLSLLLDKEADNNENNFTPIIDEVIKMKHILTKANLFVDNNNEGDIIQSISKMKKELSELQVVANTVPLLSEENKELTQNSKKLKEENIGLNEDLKDLKSTFDRLMVVMSDSEHDDVVDSVSKMKRSYSKILELVDDSDESFQSGNESLLTKEMPHENSKDHLKDRDPADQIAEMKETLQSIAEVFTKNNDSIKIRNRNDLVNLVSQTKKAIDKIMDITGANGLNQVIKSVSKLNKRAVEQENEINTIQADFQKATLKNQALKDENKKVLSDLNNYESVIEQMKNENSLLNETVENINRVINNDMKGNNTIEAVSNMNNTIGQLQSIFGTKDIVQAVNEMKNDNSLLSETVENINKAINNGGTNNNNNNTVETISNMNDTIGQLQSILGTKDIVQAVNEMKNDQDRLINFAQYGKNSSNKNDVFSDLIEKTQKFKELETKLHENNLIPDGEDGDLSSIFQEIVNQNKNLKKIENIFNDAELVDASSSNPALQNILKNISGKTAYDKVETLKSCLIDSITLLNTVLSIAKGTTVIINLPITPSESKSYQDLISNLRKRYDSLKNEKDAILQRARSQGFVFIPNMNTSINTDNSALNEAINFFVNDAIAKEKSNYIERMHQELNSVRVLTAKEREAFENQKKSLQEKISNMRQTIQKMQEMSAKREEELQDAIDAAEAAKRNAENETITEGKIRAELLRVVAGETADLDLLSLKLKTNEMQMIRKKVI